MSTVRSVLARARFYVREFSGEAAYDRYVAHARSHDPDAEVLTRRAFERARTDAREADPARASAAAELPLQAAGPAGCFRRGLRACLSAPSP